MPGKDLMLWLALSSCGRGLSATKSLCFEIKAKSEIKSLHCFSKTVMRLNGERIEQRLWKNSAIKSEILIWTQIPTRYAIHPTRYAIKYIITFVSIFISPKEFYEKYLRPECVTDYFIKSPELWKSNKTVRFAADKKKSISCKESIRNIS